MPTSRARPVTVGARLGQERFGAAAQQAPAPRRRRLPAGGRWSSNTRQVSIFFGRLIPGVRSLISLPAGAHGCLSTVQPVTLAGSGLWNGVLVGVGAALGTQYALVERYSRFLNYAVYAVLAGWSPG